MRMRCGNRAARAPGRRGIHHLPSNATSTAVDRCHEFAMLVDAHRQQLEAALAECQPMTRRPTAAAPLEVSLKLQERLAGCQGMSAALARKLAHSFPGSPCAYVALATLLHTQLLQSSLEPSTHSQRSRIIQAHTPVLLSRACHAVAHAHRSQGPLSEQTRWWVCRCFRRATWPQRRAAQPG